MEKLEFDRQGYLKPYEKIGMTLEEFQVFFVDNFPQSKTRALIFEQYLQFIEDFKQNITLEFEHWLDGSFLTQKLHPNDLDFVMLLDNKVVVQHACREVATANRLHSPAFVPVFSHSFFTATTGAISVQP